MTRDEDRGSMVDVRARGAARAFRRRLDALEPHAPANLERFDRYRHRKQRTERVAVVLIAAAVSVVAAVALVRAMPNRTTPTSVPPSPNGRIVFGRSVEGDARSLFTTDAAGADEQRLSLTVTDCAEWSPDGSSMHITASEYPGAPLRPALIDASGGGFRLLPPDASTRLNLGCGDWSPDGSRLLLEGFGSTAHAGLDGVYSMRAADGSDLLRVTRGHDQVPQYAPDGSAIVFLRTRPARYVGRDVGALFVAGVDGSNVRRITPWGATSSSGSWSGDGAIVFASPGGDLWTVQPDGFGLARVAVHLDGQPYQPRWAPDGTAIVFGLERAGQPDLYTVRPDGTELTQLTDTPGVGEWWPDWGVAATAG